MEIFEARSLHNKNIFLLNLAMHDHVHNYSYQLIINTIYPTQNSPSHVSSCNDVDPNYSCIINSTVYVWWCYQK